MAALPEDDPLAVRLLYSPHDPTDPQHAYLLLGELGVLEAMYGGAAGGGKSDALLMAALQYVDVPGYAALLLRRTYADLSLPGALMDRADTWLAGSDAVWHGDRFRWRFPSGASLTFGYLATSRDRYRYASAEFQFIGFDELTQFPIADYRFLFTRLRRPELNDDTPPLERRRIEALAAVPLRMRSASNPGGVSHEAVKSRFILREVDQDDPDDTPERAARRIFIPAKLDDNPHVDRTSYRQALAQSDPITRARLEHGDWDVEEGDKVYSSAGITAARYLGDLLDRELEAGTIPPPAGGLLAVGLDWGEHTHGLIGWPLEAGGMYVVAELVSEAGEPGAFADAMVDLITTIVSLGQRPRPKGYMPPDEEAGLKLIVARRRPGPVPPALATPPRSTIGARTTAALRLIEEHRYDAAGVQSMRTYSARVRRHYQQAKSKSVPFGAPAPRSGAAATRRSYKAETIGHLRRLLLRAVYGELANDPDFDALHPPPPPDPPNANPAGALAIGKRCPILRRQLPALEWADREAGKVRKGDDHGPDALIALDAPNAIRHRR